MTFIDFGADKQLSRDLETVNKTDKLLKTIYSKYKEKQENLANVEEPVKTANIKNKLDSMTDIFMKTRGSQSIVKSAVNTAKNFINENEDLDPKEFRTVLDSHFESEFQDTEYGMENKEFLKNYIESGNDPYIKKLTEINSNLEKNQSVNQVYDSWNIIENMEGLDRTTRVELFKELGNTAIEAKVITKSEFEELRRNSGFSFLERELDKQLEGANYQEINSSIELMKNAIDTGNKEVYKTLGLEPQDRIALKNKFESIIDDPNNNIYGTLEKYEKDRNKRAKNYGDYLEGKNVVNLPLEEKILGALSSNDDPVFNVVSGSKNKQDFYLNVLEYDYDLNSVLTTKNKEDLKVIAEKSPDAVYGALQQSFQFDLKDNVQKELLNKLTIEYGGDTPELLEFKKVNPEFDATTRNGESYSSDINLGLLPNFMDNAGADIYENLKKFKLFTAGTDNLEENSYYTKKLNNYVKGFLVQYAKPDKGLLTGFKKQDGTLDPNSLTPSDFSSIYENLDKNKKKLLIKKVEDYTKMMVNNSTRNVVNDGQGNFISSYGVKEEDYPELMKNISNLGATWKNRRIGSNVKDYRLSFHPDGKTFNMTVDGEKVKINGSEMLPISKAVLNTEEYKTKVKEDTIKRNKEIEEKSINNEISKISAGSKYDFNQTFYTDKFLNVKTDSFGNLKVSANKDGSGYEGKKFSDTLIGKGFKAISDKYKELTGQLQPYEFRDEEDVKELKEISKIMSEELNNYIVELDPRLLDLYSKNLGYEKALRNEVLTAKDKIIISKTIQENEDKIKKISDENIKVDLKDDTPEGAYKFLRNNYSKNVSDSIMAISLAESSWNPKSTSKHSSAKGALQIIDQYSDIWGIPTGAKATDFSFTEQMRYIVPQMIKKVSDRDLPLNIDNLYLALHYPKGLGKSKTWVAYSKDNKLKYKRDQYEANKGLDIEKKGYVTIEDIVHHAKKQKNEKKYKKLTSK